MSHYKTLNIDKNATADDIKKAYRKMASKHHPDKGGSKEEFQKIEEAYRTLGDPEKRQLHDNPHQSNPAGFSFNFGGGPAGMHDIFNEMFRQQAHTQHRNHQQYRTTMWVTMEQVFNGGEQSLRLQTTAETHVVSIAIPRGVQDGAQMRHDNVFPGASLIIEFRVHPHLKFERRGQDLVCTCPVSVLDLIIGTEFEFTSLSGAKLMVTIPPLTQPTAQLKISGYGLPIPNTNQYADQIILLKPFVPANIPITLIDSIRAYTMSK
jgi:DnaJ-class molecular chaperone